MPASATRNRPSPAKRDAGQAPESGVAPGPVLEPRQRSRDGTSAEIGRELDDPAALVGDVRGPARIHDDSDRTQRQSLDVARQRRDRSGGIDPADGAVAAVGDVDVAGRIGGDPARRIESRQVCSAILCAGSATSGDRCDDAVTRDRADAVVVGVRDDHTALRIDGDPDRAVEARLAAGAVGIAGDTVTRESGDTAIGRDATNRVIAGIRDVENTITIDRDA